MPHFSSANAAGTTSELIRLWRSRLKASPAKHHDNPLPPPPPTTLPPPPPPTPPLLLLATSNQGVLSQQSKMSEAQDSSRVLERRQSSDTGIITRQKSEIDEEKDNSDLRDAPSTPKSESQQQQQQHEKTELPAATLASAQQQRQQQQQQQRTSVGECNNLLPVLVERLRSALELSCSASPSCSEDNNQLPSLEDSGVDSEEDLRLWTTLNEQQQQQQQQQQTSLHKPKLDLKFLEDILLADIHTALARLQDTLKRVDVNTLTRYNASLDSSNKLYLLRLISNLLAKLKVPEEVKQQQQRAISEAESSFRRRKNDRHTISVSAEEIARARLWLDDSSCESSPKIVLEKQPDATERIVEGAPSSGEQTQETTSMSIDSTFNDKCMKDAINQQQSLQSKKDNAVARRFDGLCKDDIGLNENKERRSSVFYPRHNKFSAKKSKLKRANTIDIPNYLQLKSDSPEQVQNGCFALRRPIDVSDRISVNGAKKAVPLFEPKTDNDRKFLALINKNNSADANVNNAAAGPFKSFSYRNPASVADKNWQNRFSSIKTNFDKQSIDSDGETTTTQPKRKPGIVDVRKKFETPREETDGMVVRVVPYGPAKQQQSSFTHAPTSPFQKIEKSAAIVAEKMESMPSPQAPFLKPGYAPKTRALQAKLKMFDQEAKNKPPEPLKKIAPAPAPTSQQMQQQQPVENGHLNYYSFCKQFAPFAHGKQDGKSSVDATKSKLLTNLTKEPGKAATATKKDKSKGRTFMARQDNEDNRYDFSKQYSYHKPYDAYAENYRQLDKKPQFNNTRGLYGQPPATTTTTTTTTTTQSNDRLKRFDAPITQSVAVQTTNESNERRPSEPELIDCIADYPVPMPRKQRNSVSVQTTSPQVVASSMYSGNPMSPLPPPQTATSPSIVSPIPYPQPTYKPTSYNEPPPPPPPTTNYYNPSYLSDQNYYTTDNSVGYPSYEAQQPTAAARSAINDSQAQILRPILQDCHQRPAESTITHLPICQKLYNEFSKLPDPQPPRDYSKSDAIPNFVPYDDKVDAFEPIVQVYEEKLALSDVAEEHIENQELSSDGIVTRYTSAIATVSSMPPDSPEPTTYEPVVPRIKEAQPRHFAETTSIPVPITERKSSSVTPVDEIQRHNMLQQSLIRRMQNEQQQQQQQHVVDKIPTRRFSQEIPMRKENLSPSPTQIGRVCALKALNESHKAQEKIHMFEERRLTGKQLFRPVNVPSKLNPPAPTIQNERSPIRSPIDSSDEYLMSCANKPTRNIVLSKSESWHQLALASKGGLQLPQATTQQKPPKPKSPMRFTKQFEASATTDNMRKMEEKVQQYFQGSTAAAAGGGGHGETTRQTKSKSRRQLQSKKTSNSLMRSHTMPHLYDDRLFDDTVDVDQAFDSIFKEATRTDNRLS